MAETGGNAAPGPRKWNFNTTAGVVAVAVGALIFVIIPSQVEPRMRVFGMPPEGVAPEVWPIIVATSFVLTGIWLIWRSMALREENALRTLDREAIVNVSVTAAAFFAFAFLMEPLGFVISASIVAFGLSTFYGNRSLLLGAALSIGVPLVLFNAFTRLLQVYLPKFPYLPDVLWF